MFYIVFRKHQPDPRLRGNDVRLRGNDVRLLGDDEIFALTISVKEGKNLQQSVLISKPHIY
jgi:hypothetical protein